jgi:hyperosmotically inducible protein
MDLNEKTEHTRVVVDTPEQRRVTETSLREPRSGPSAGTIAIVAIVAVMTVGVILYMVSNRNANESADRSANLSVASQENKQRAPPATPIQQPVAPAQQAPVIIQPAPAAQAPIIVQQPVQATQKRDSASDDANMQEVAATRLGDESDMTRVSISIIEARAVLTGSVNSEAAKSKAEKLVKAVRGVKSVDNQIVVLS